MPGVCASSTQSPLEGKVSKVKWPTYLSLSLVAMILGVLLVFQFRVVRYIEQGVSLGRVQELTVELRQLEKEKLKLAAEASDLSAKLQQAGQGQAEAEKALEGELEKARLLAGLVPVTGPGVEVTLDNPPANRGWATSLYVIRDEDLLRVVNELRGAGAEAISINGQRIVATSEIRWAAPFINVNLTRLVPPYHILAIGNPGNLRSALEIPGGLVEYLQELGVQVKIQAHDRLTVPGYNRPLEFRYAKPVVKE